MRGSGLLSQPVDGKCTGQDERHRAQCARRGIASVSHAESPNYFESCVSHSESHILLTEMKVRRRVTPRRRGRPPTVAAERRQAGTLPLNQSVEKALAVLRAFGGKRRALTLGDIAAAAEITKSSAQRISHTLQYLGLVKRDVHARGWVLSPRVLTIGYAYLSGHALIEGATSHLLGLNTATGESVSLSEPDGTHMVYVARFPGHRPFQIHMPVGRTLPMFCTAAGRAYLSRLPMDEVGDILDRTTFRALTSTTVTDRKRVLTLIQEARESGYARANQECYRGDLTIGAAVMGPHGRPVAAINLAGPTSRWTLDDLAQRWAPLLMETARAASSGMAERIGAAGT
jgi:IclR family transcriptional regulator, pca regulon regulatory protein